MKTASIRVEQIHGEHRIVEAWDENGEALLLSPQVAYTKPTGFGMAVLVVFADGSEFAYAAGAKVEIAEAC